METTHSPFAALTLIVAPAMLTNASCVLAMSTINRMLKTRERMRELYLNSEKKIELAESNARDAQREDRQVDRVEKQAGLLLSALGSIYIALGSFALATLVSLLGAAFTSLAGQIIFQGIEAVGFILGVVGVGGLVMGSARLFQATRLSLLNIQEEADAIRQRHASAANSVRP